jgi:hypothetical protein
MRKGEYNNGFLYLMGINLSKNKFSDLMFLKGKKRHSVMQVLMMKRLWTNHDEVR